MLNSNNYNFMYFYGGGEVVSSLEEGALRNGGATKYADKIISNIETNEFIEIKEENEISIFIPSTINVNIQIDNREYLEKIINKIADRYSLNELTFYNAEGSWLDEITNEVIIEKITIVTLKTKEINDIDVRFFIKLAEFLKIDMIQQGISLRINDSLAII